MAISPHYQRLQVLYPAQQSIPGDSTHGVVPSSDDDTVTSQVLHGAGIRSAILHSKGWSPLPPSYGQNLTGIRTGLSSNQYQALFCLPAGVVKPLRCQGVAGDPLARGEGQTGRMIISIEARPTTYYEAVLGVVVSIF